MDSELAVLRRRVQGHEGGRGKRYPTELRTQLRRWIGRRRSEGASAATIAAELSLPLSTVSHWASTRSQSTALVPIEVVPDRRPSRTLRVLSPSGFAVDGLTVEEAASLLRLLG